MVVCVPSGVYFVFPSGVETSSDWGLKCHHVGIFYIPVAIPARVFDCVYDLVTAPSPDNRNIPQRMVRTRCVHPFFSHRPFHEGW